jgi:hypothetical protein
MLYCYDLFILTSTNMDPNQVTPPPGQAAQDPNQGLQVKVPDEVQKGVYSNAVSVNVNSNEVVLDFGYLLPNTPTPVIEVVSRVNMNHKTADSFFKVLEGAMKDFEAKQAAMNATQNTAPAPEASMPAPMPAPAPMPPAQPMNPMNPMDPMNPGMGNPMPPLPQNA